MPKFVTHLQDGLYDIARRTEMLCIFLPPNLVNYQASSEELRTKVEKARKIQQERYAQEKGINCNAQMTTELIQRYCVLDKDSLKLLRETSEKYGYSARVIHKLLRLARTSADLDGEEKIRQKDIEKVLTCRELDKSNSKMVVVK